LSFGEKNDQRVRKKSRENGRNYENGGRTYKEVRDVETDSEVKS